VGIVEIATAAMVRALRTVSVERGVDPRDMTLVAFGGAGPMFACRMADSLGMRRAVVPPHAGVLSALGLASAPEKLEFVDSLHRRADGLGLEELDVAYRGIEAAAGDELAGASLSRFADCRYIGQGYELTVPVTGSGEQIAAAFHGVHAERFGHADEGRPVEAVNVRVVAERGGTEVRLAARSGAPMAPPVAGRVAWDSVTPGTLLEGPLMLDSLDATTRIEEGWRGRMHQSGAVVLQRI
jgi:N-methylhydantoinase A